MTALLDSSGWIELLSDSGRAELFEPVLDCERLIVPSIVRYEVGRYALIHMGEAGHFLALRALSKFDEAPLDAAIADAAVMLGKAHNLAMADAIIYATAQMLGAELWTQDQHFQGLAGVRFFHKT